MRDVVRNLPQALHQAGDPVQHPVDRRSQAIEVVVRVARRHTSVEVAIDDGLSRSGDRRQAPVHVAAEAEASQESKDNHAGESPSEVLQDGLLKIFAAVVIISDDQPVVSRQLCREHPDRLVFVALRRCEQPRPPQAGPAARKASRHRLSSSAFEAVIERAGRAVAFTHGLDYAGQPFRPELLGQSGGFGLDARVELLSQ